MIDETEKAKLEHDLAGNLTKLKYLTLLVIDANIADNELLKVELIQNGDRVLDEIISTWNRAKL